MWKNYMLAALNVAVAGLPFLVGWDLVLYGVYCGFAVLLLGLTAWNPVGDWFSILFVFYAKAVPEEALIMPALRRYLREAISGKGYLKPKCRFYYAESRIPYFIPISRKRVVLSLALEDYLIHDYDGNLYRDVPDEAYIPNLVLSRKTLLLSIFCYVLSLRFIELWTIIAAVIVRLVFAARGGSQDDGSDLDRCRLGQGSLENQRVLQLHSRQNGGVRHEADDDRNL